MLTQYSAGLKALGVDHSPEGLWDRAVICVVLHGAYSLRLRTLKSGEDAEKFRGEYTDRMYLADTGNVSPWPGSLTIMVSDLGALEAYMT